MTKIVPDLPLDCGRGLLRAEASGGLIKKRGGDTLQDVVSGRCGECIAERLLKCAQRGIPGHVVTAACGF